MAEQLFIVKNSARSEYSAYLKLGFIAQIAHSLELWRQNQFSKMAAADAKGVALKREISIVENHAHLSSTKKLIDTRIAVIAGIESFLFQTEGPVERNDYC